MNQEIINERWNFARSELKKFQNCYKNQNKKTQDKIQEIVKYYDLSFKDLNKTISKKDNERLMRKIAEWKDLGVYTGYFKYCIEELIGRSCNYRALIEILIYGAFVEEEISVFEEITSLNEKVALDCYNQGLKDLKKEKVDAIPKKFMNIFYLTLIDGILFRDYLSALYLTNAQEIQKQYFINLQQENELDVYGDYMQRQFEKQQNKLIAINEDKFSGGLDKYVTALGNMAYIEAGGEENRIVKLISDRCDNVTEMCLYMDGMTFNTKKRNVFKRPIGKSAKDLAIQEVNVQGLVVGINLPPISEHFHWCHSILTFQV